MCRNIYLLALVFCLSRDSLGSSSAEVLQVQPGENVTLRCNIPTTIKTLWYQQSGADLTFLLSITIGKLDPENPSVMYNEDSGHSGHFVLSEQSVNGSFDLDIVSVGPSDVGFYYCAVWNTAEHLQFGKAIRLTLEGQASGETSETRLCWTLLISAGCLFFLTLVLCVAMLYKQGLPSTMCVNCVKGNSTLKASELHYASLRHMNIKRNPPPAAPNVTYDTVANKSSSSKS